jgi:hypothetical protein
MIATAVSLVRHAGKIPLSEFINIVRLNRTLLTSCSPLFCPGSSIESGSLEKSHLVVVEDVCLRSANIWVYYR